MTIEPRIVEQMLLSLERSEHPKLLVPQAWKTKPEKPVWPVSPTDVLTHYRKRHRPYLTDELATMPDGSIFLEGWGWCAIGEPEVLRAEGDFRTSAPVLRAICTTDLWLQPTRQANGEWMLTARLAENVALLLMSGAWWLMSRNNAFAAWLQQAAAEANAAEEAAKERLPVIVVRSLAAPPGESIH